MSPEQEMVQLQVTKEKLGSFLSCLAIGTLQAIQKGTLPAEAGIWSLGAPKVWEPLAERSLVSQSIVEVLQECDELDAMQKLLPNEYEARLVDLMNQLHKEFTKFSDPIWQIEWVMEDD